MDLINIRRVAWDARETPAVSLNEDLVALITQKILERLN
jgi:hypothetical protein